MKNSFLILMSLFLINCTSDDSKPKEENSKLQGKWKIIEQLMDPGDGSGTFTSIDSNRVIEFFSNGTVTVNGTLCYASTEVGASNSGTYSATEENEFRDGQITPNDCASSDTKIFYKIEGVNLILWYPCIEPCGQKFVKLTN